jgi:hypothetical protein
MHVCLRLAIVAAVVLSGLPHAFCACGCKPATVEESRASCHSCCDASPQQDSEPSEPCKCRTCHVAKAVPPAPAARAPALEPTAGCVSMVAVPSERLTVGDGPDGFGIAGPPQALPPPNCSLSILFGHMLL